MNEHLHSVGDVARLLGVRPSQITALFYSRKIPDDLCPIVGGRRLIGDSEIHKIAQVLKSRGLQVSSYVIHSAEEGGTSDQ